MTRLAVLLLACAIATPALAINETEVLRGTPAPPPAEPAPVPQQPAIVEVPVYYPPPVYYYYVPVRRPVVIHHRHHFRH